jgi:KDO2-lipid IV(A) lauroyltransferase
MIEHPTSTVISSDLEQSPMEAQDKKAKATGGRPVPKRKKSKPFYNLRWRLGAYCVRGVLAVYPRLPRVVRVGFFQFGNHFSYLVLRKYRKRLKNNVAALMGDQFPTPEMRKEFVRRVWHNLWQVIYDTTWIIFAPKDEIRTTIDIVGEEHLIKALAKNRGVIGLSAHLGIFTIIGARLAAEGYRFTGVVNLPGEPRYAEFMTEMRARAGMETLPSSPRREAARQIIKALRQNYIVLILADGAKRDGVEVTFLGHPQVAPRGPVTLAIRTGAAILPMFIIRCEDGRRVLHIKPEIELPQTGDLMEDVIATVKLFMKELEAMVRRYPDQWEWIGYRERRSRNTKISKSNAHSTNQKNVTGANF